MQNKQTCVLDFVTKKDGHNFRVLKHQTTLQQSTCSRKTLRPANPTVSVAFVCYRENAELITRINFALQDSHSLPIINFKISVPTQTIPSQCSNPNTKSSPNAHSLPSAAFCKNLIPFPVPLQTPNPPR
jgi:hypothetical protein